ncbi:DUF3105 domain-containing protein [Thermoactinospora rubra]|uniref:DUF3105 domain-containing protein n=1 Tax=Thermoactinospora rubra TaxID=1088767 RepID=UPI000A11968C|nr:DUF3105 domain-containing protein [Thermoactinospora rubra]
MTKEKAQARREHLAKIRAEQKRRERRTAMLIWGAGGLVLVVLVGLVAVYLVRQNQATSLAAATSASYQANEHTWDPVAYKETPPMGGEHNGYWQRCAIYDKPIHNEHAVHSLEHGAVWITYQPNLPQDKVAKLKEVASTTGDPEFMLMSPYEGLPAPIVVSSWNHQLKLTDPADPRLPAFVKEYQNNPKTTPEFGATCGGENSITTTKDQQPLPPKPAQQSTPTPTPSPTASR